MRRDCETHVILGHQERDSARSRPCLFIDIVGYSKLSINDQHAAVEPLNPVGRASAQFQRAEAAGRLLKIPTGDGMALVFYASRSRPRNARWKSAARSRNRNGR